MVSINTIKIETIDSKYAEPNQSNFRGKEHAKSRKYNLLIISIVLFLSGLISSYILSPKFSQLLQVIAIPCFLYSGYILATQHIQNKYFRFVLYMLLLSNVYTLIRLESINYEQLKIYLFSDYAFWPYFVPLVVFIKRTPVLFKTLFNWVIILGILFLLVLPLLWNKYTTIEIFAEQAIWIFSSGCGLVLLNSRYLSLSKRIIAFATILLALYISTLLARRNLMLTNINFLLFTFLLYFIFLKGYAVWKLLSIYAVAVFLFVGFMIFKSKADTDFKIILNRATDDTREYVFAAFFADMKNDLWLGKGIDGTYFCPMVTDDEEFIYRYIIECGYLQVVLKGGLVNLFLFLLILVPAMFLGIFKSNNLFSKACGIVIFLWLIDMIPYGLPNFSIRYIIVWVCVGVCFDKKIRELSENRLEKMLIQN